MRRSVEVLEYRHSSASREAEVRMGRAHSSENRWTLGSQSARMATPQRLTQRRSAQRGGKMTSGESLGAAGHKRPRTVDCGTPHKRPISSSGRQLV
ncbi:jg11779 [Pararge aegeria aegeria]|uniref:Jg11779 protein n=1 Tax=Pararge aegeria aegeria TaxID=348720 RepID=A0A8S4RDK6_9NEOP|nr:jg11779 [Pararge aegeria aegeria]